MIHLSNVPQSLCIKMILGFKPAIVLSAIVAEVDIQQLAHACNHRRRNDFQSGGGGGQFFGSLNWRVSAGRRKLHDAGGCLRGDVPPWKVGAFFENVDSNEVIWCTIFHHNY